MKKKLLISKCFIYLIIILLFAFILRVPNLYSDYVFAGNDAPFFASYALDLTNISDPILWFGKLINFPWGFITPILITPWVGLLSIFNVTINEFMLTFPITVVGVLSVFAIYLLGKEFGGKKVGLLSALILSILPLHVAQSRDIGGTWIVGPFLLILTVLFFVKYFKHNKSQYSIIASIMFTLLMLSSNLFIGAIPLIFYIGFIYEYNKEKNKKENKKNRFKKTFINTFKKLLNKKIILLPSLILVMHIIAFIILYYFGHPELGFLGHILIRAKTPGFYLVPLIKYFIIDYGLFLICMIPFAIGYGFKALTKISNKSILLLWILIYSFPFIFLISPLLTGVSTYINYYIIPIIILLSMFIVDLMKYKNLIIKIVTVVILLLMFVFTINATFEKVYRFSMLSGEKYQRCSAFDHDKDQPPCLQGSVKQNQGAKTAGYYIRKHIPEDAKIFTDLRTATANYYFGRDAYSGTHLSREQILVDLSNIKNDVDIVVIQNINLENTEKIITNDFNKIVDIYSKDKPVLHIFSKTKINNQNLIRLDTEDYDLLFDKEFGNIQSLRRDVFNQASHNPKYDDLIKRILDLTN